MTSPSKPIIFIHVRGGVAEWEVLRGDVEVVFIDYDNEETGDDFSEEYERLDEIKSNLHGE